MRAFFAKDGLRRFKRTILPFLGVFAVGTALLWWPTNWCCQEFVKAIRDALMVAGVIGLCIELWSADVLVEHTADQLSEQLVGYGLPKAAQAVIKSLVHTRRVYRNYRVVYRIERPEGSDRVAVHETASYKVVNNGLGPENYKPKLFEEGTYKPELKSLEYRGKRYTPKPEINKRTGVVSWEPSCNEVPIAASGANEPIEGLSSDKVCDVRWEYRMEMPTDYSTVVAFAGVVVNPVVEVSGSETLELSASQDEEHACTHAENGALWEYGRAFVAGQHTRVWWRPKNISS
ncbi:MAG TPA: hypothetical protein VK335_03960 [Bryobacteraceae bacterium]|nr:hypothetical protein [Bryobacteraceae bacterium]